MLRGWLCVPCCLLFCGVPIDAVAVPADSASQPKELALDPTIEDAPAPARTAALPSAAQTDSADDLRHQLKLRDALLARHDQELRELRALLLSRLPPPIPAVESSQGHAWYDRLQIRGYMQTRYNQLPSAASNENLINEQGDKSIGKNGGLYIRRARVILFGDVHPRLSIYIQPDFASAIGDQLNVGIVRDFYADVFLDRKKEFRLRIGQSKIPFGFENLQSSQNRIPPDRSDALNSAWQNERELGVFFYWAPAHIRARFRHLVDSGLKGSGDYGVVGFGVFNGQILNRPEQNAYPHVVARVTWPFAIGSQFLELGGGGYYGKYTVKIETPKDTPLITSASPDNTLDEARGHVTAVLYPKPVGLICELNVGIGPSLGVDEPTRIDSRFLYGGYAQVMWRFSGVLGTPALIPFARGTLYSGGKKFFANAPHYEVKEIEFGAEWQLVPALEVVVSYLIADRTSDKYPYRQESGHVTRLHVQMNY
ncbi:MAG: porin [Elusimicrobia bacterium]|nr:MAG: porin [Elusimicrobiota bacterium]